MTLKEKIEQHRKAQLEAKKAQAREEFLANYDPTEGMSTTEKLLAGVGQGMTNVGRQVGNIVGLVDDEEIAKAKAMDEALLNTGAGAVGAFGGEMAALAPLGLVGNVAKGATMLPRALRAGKALPVARGGAGLPGAAAALTEGAAAGAILAGPDERGSGAVGGGLTGYGLNKTLGALGRKFTKGFDESKPAQEFGNLVEDLTGKRPSLPVAQSAEARAVAYPHKSILSMFPLARGGSKKMEAQATQDWGEAVLVQTFGKKNRDAVMEAVSAADGDLVTAGQSLLKKMGNKGYKANRDALKTALDEMKAGEILTPNRIDAAAKKIAKGEERPFYQLTSAYGKVMEEALEESTVSGRRAYNKIMNKAAPATLGAAVSGGAIPYMALTGATWGATRPGMQNFMMGRGPLNRGMEAVGRAGSPYANAIRNTIAGQ